MGGRKNPSSGVSSESSDETSSSNHPQEEENPKDNAVLTWLRFLQMERYARDFFDNGYDDMETVKRIGKEDLDAIGVSCSSHRAFILDAVRVLREQGAVWVYLLQQDRVSSSTHSHHCQAGGDYDFGDRVSAGSSGIASANSSSCSPWVDNEQDFASGENSSSSSSSRRHKGLRTSPVSSRSSPAVTQRCLVELTPEHLRHEQLFRRAASSANAFKHSPRTLPKRISSSQEEDEDEDVYDDHDEDVIRLVNEANLNEPSHKPYSQYSSAIKGKLIKDGINLGSSPFSTKSGGDGYLLALASRYAFELGIAHRDVLRGLESIRWDEENDSHTYANQSVVDQTSSSLKDPLKPGKYASSSCLSDKDEDIYDYAPDPGSRFSSRNNTNTIGWYQMAKRVICRNKDPVTPKKSPTTPTSPPTPMLTRTRLRPGGPDTNFRNGSLPSVSDEEISMKTLGLRRGPIRREPLFPVSSAFYGTLATKPATPLVKQRTIGCASPRVQMYRTRVVYSDAGESPGGRIKVMMPPGSSSGNKSQEAAV